MTTSDEFLVDCIGDVCHIKDVFLIGYNALDDKVLVPYNRNVHVLDLRNKATVIGRALTHFNHNKTFAQTSALA